MKEIVIHLEGGGDHAKTRSQLRQGMNAFLRPLKELADSKGWRWQLVALGGRGEAYQHWRRAVETDAKALHVLLVDSEEEVTRSTDEHLRNRQADGWAIAKALETQVHLMAQCMEAWLVADPDALAKYYGWGFERERLPKCKNLEEEPKADILQSLDLATKKTQKGPYGKITHASKLLQLIDAAKVRAKCPHCERLFVTLEGKFGEY